MSIEREQTTTILSGVMGHPIVRVVREPREVIQEAAARVTERGQQQATSGRLPKNHLDDLQAVQRAQREAALG
jgi:hypothetical protein